MKEHDEMRNLSIAILILAAAACGGDSHPPPGVDTPGASCTGLTGNYSASGTAETGSTCDASLSTIAAAAMVSGDATNGYTLALTVGGIDYSCNGVVSTCRLDATCTGTAADGSMVRGMMTVNFTDAGFSGTMTEDFTGTTNCHNMFSISATRS
jgi:hypothetical protein